MNCRKRINAFHLNYDLVVHQDVDSVPAIQMDTFVLDRNRMLQTEGNIGNFEFVGQTLLVSGLQQARPEMPVHLNRAPDHPVGQGIELQLSLSLRALRGLRG